MGKQFLTRSRQDWEALLVTHPQDESQLRGGASKWLAARLEGYVQSIPDAPITLAVPDRFLEILGDPSDNAIAEAVDVQA